MKYMFFALTCMCVMPLVTHAECDYQRQAELSRLASNVQFAYTADIGDKIAFDLTVTNLTDDLYMVDSYGNYFTGEETTLTYSGADMSGFGSGETVTFIIYSNDANCYGTKILTKYITFPEYNLYSNMDECTNNPTFKYCQFWLNTSSLTLTQFYSEYEAYIEEQNEVTESEEVEESSFWSTLSELFDDAVVRIGLIVCAVIIVGLLVYKIVKSKVMVK